ncbi:FkbM family methyltransferase [Amycolatopsis saalfeldensis]|uniref:Methyltransferase, FkbM family n=1 Tax=Amycolatopsis saalfeldensis TaxID=394193 RepID=A0A1H8YA83_9PSEU|nr:FkbM family methyltransferase [Amycolatopsis saalfeldensis]SEP48398.1 methyltransferase, FkbM family [Amycolatopsis saalfeldensis]
MTTSQCTLPNGLACHCVDEAQVATLYREIFDRRCWLDRGLTLADGDFVVDAGANIGLSTLFFHLERPNLRFLCFEPAPVPFEALQRNVAQHGIHAVCRPVALGATAGDGVLTYYPRVAAMSSLRADPVADATITRTYLRNSGLTDEDACALVPGDHEGMPVPCRIVRLADEIGSAGLPRVDLLKVDVEKSELDVLAGLDASTWPLVRQVALEVHDADGVLDAVCHTLSNAGFAVQVRQDPLLSGTNIHDVAGIRPGGGRS